MRRGAIAALGLVLCGCAPSGQLVLYVDTDAPVPAAPGAAPDPTRPPPLFDRLRVDVLDAGAVVATRDFPVDDQLFVERRASVGVAPAIGDGTLTARVRLFRGDRLVDGEPPPTATLDTTAPLPAIGRTDRRELTIVLHVDDVGAPVAADALDGAPVTSLVGSWPGAARVPCDGAAMADEVCVPGGAYFIGDPHATISLDGAAPVGERLVVLSPFFLDRTEVTVAAFRAKWATLGGRYAPGDRDPTQDPTSLKTWCTWTAAPADTEALPMNCILEQTAELYCEARGRQLVTEAQYEYVASGLGAERVYPWGDDEATCLDAIWGLGGGGGVDSANPGDATCLPSAALGGVAAPGSAARDRVSLGGVEVVDLAGNVAELTRDAYGGLDEGVWAAPGVLHDPLQPIESEDDSTVARGGDFHNGLYALRAGYRQAVPKELGPGVGFRCARTGLATSP